MKYTFHEPQSSNGRNARSSKLGTKHRCHAFVTASVPPASRSATVRPRAHFASTAAATWCSAKETTSAATRMYRMCDHHADALFFSELFSLLNIASGDAGASGGSLCAWRFGGDLALGSQTRHRGVAPRQSAAGRARGGRRGEHDQATRERPRRSAPRRAASGDVRARVCLTLGRRKRKIPRKTRIVADKMMTLPRRCRIRPSFLSADWRTPERRAHRLLRTALRHARRRSFARLSRPRSHPRGAPSPRREPRGRGALLPRERARGGVAAPPPPRSAQGFKTRAGDGGDENAFAAKAAGDASSPPARVPWSPARSASRSSATLGLRLARHFFLAPRWCAMPAVKSTPTHMKPTMHTFMIARTPAKHVAQTNASARHESRLIFWNARPPSPVRSRAPISSASARTSVTVTPSLDFARAAARTRSGSARSGAVRSIAAATRFSPSAASKRRSAPRSSVSRSIWSLNPCASWSSAGVPQCAASYGTFPNVSNALALTTQSAARYATARRRAGACPAEPPRAGVVPLLHHLAHGPVPYERQRHPSGATLLQQVQPLLRAPAPDVREQRSVDRARAHLARASATSASVASRDARATASTGSGR